MPELESAAWEPSRPAAVVRNRVLAFDHRSRRGIPSKFGNARRRQVLGSDDEAPIEDGRRRLPDHPLFLSGMAPPGQSAHRKRARSRL